jgi:hypothetical protein
MTGLYKIWFSKRGSLNLSPAVAGLLLGLLSDRENVGYVLLRKVRISLKYKNQNTLLFMCSILLQHGKQHSYK